jgi:hypothetical protein
MCGEELVRVEKHTRVNVTVAVADATVLGMGPMLGMGSSSSGSPPRRCGWLICMLAAGWW